MRLAVYLFFAAIVCAIEPERRQASETGVDIGQISTALAHLKPNSTATANFGNISPPPKSLIPEILSVVPMPVLWDLINPASRQSLASDFRAGNTPTWYNSLPTDVKNYMSVVREQISGGALTATTGLAYETTSASTSSASSSTTDTSDRDRSTSTSSGMAAQATGLTASTIGAIGVIGLALAL
ncbi:hypothetical protein N7492_006709 [Penicillium capsulatum]|uniref:GPI anchored protein n=1 Tax=Penicillium capsulatum TaxID=69766 RepID=A0A9W9HYH1_9EURO|nr:hypothetical protein N7492_006709 [Penicillium capsulatum]KAJ6116544.1 hypothetical protein N7512_006269 [Penicillium capsulatum]